MTEVDAIRGRQTTLGPQKRPSSTGTNPDNKREDAHKSGVPSDVTPLPILSGLAFLLCVVIIGSLGGDAMDKGVPCAPWMHKRTHHSITAAWGFEPVDENALTSFQVEKQQHESADWSLGCVSIGVNQCELGGLLPDTVYHIRVRASNYSDPSAWGQWSEISDIRTRIQPKSSTPTSSTSTTNRAASSVSATERSSPSDLDAPRLETRTGSTITLSCSRPSNGALELQIYRSGWVFGSWVTVKPEVQHNQAIVKELTPDTGYRFRYRVQGSAWSPSTSTIFTTKQRIEPALPATSSQQSRDTNANVSLWTVVRIAFYVFLVLMYFALLLFASAVAQYYVFVTCTVRKLSQQYAYTEVFVFTFAYALFWMVLCIAKQYKQWEWIFILAYILWLGIAAGVSYVVLPKAGQSRPKSL